MMLTFIICGISIILSSMICNTIGSAILHRLHPTATYLPWDAFRAGATGGGILLVSLGVAVFIYGFVRLTQNFSRPLNQRFGRTPQLTWTATWTSSTVKDKIAYLWIAIGIGAISSPVAGAIGGAALNAIAGTVYFDEDTQTYEAVPTIKQTVAESAASGGLGGAIWIAAWLAVSLLLGAGYMLHAKKNWMHDKLRERRRRRAVAGMREIEQQMGEGSLALREQ